MINPQLIQDYEESERFFWSTICSATAQINGADVYATGVVNRYLNVAIQKVPLSKDTFQNVLSDIQSFYNALHLPWVWSIRDNMISADLMKTELLELLDTSTTMYCNLANPLPNKSPRGLLIQENNTDLTDWGGCLRKAYQSPFESVNQHLEVVNQYIEAHKKPSWDRLNFHHYVGYLDTIPISTTTLSIHEKNARIDDVGTIPEYQSKGYATQMIVHALTQAKKQGASFCFLESSNAGKGIYKRIGFQDIFANSYFQIATQAS